MATRTQVTPRVENNSFVIQDVYTIMNEIVQQATARKDLAVVDTSSFVSVGETVLRTGTENTLNAISAVLTRTIFAVRPYNAKLRSLMYPEQRWGGILRKITPFLMDYEASQDWNTNLTPQQLADGNSIDMYKIRAPKAVQTNFIGSNTLQTHITIFRKQLRIAFSSEQEFMRFLDAVMIQFRNSIELRNENTTRLTLASYIAGLIDMPNRSVDLTAAYNTQFGTTYTRDQLLNEHLTEFMQFFVAYIKTTSDRFTDFTSMYHSNLENHPDIVRHTPYSAQRMIMYGPMFTNAEARVFSEIFNPLYLKLNNNIELVNYWQSPKTPEAINITPAILDTTTGEKKTGNPVNNDYIVGVLFDRDACGVMPQWDSTSTTPYNSAGEYYNTFVHWLFGSNIDYTENGIVFYLGSGGAST